VSLKSLNSTFIYNHLNRSNGITNNIANLLKNGKVITMKELEEPLMIITKNFKFPFKFKVLESINNGTIEMRYGVGSKLPTALPFFLVSDAEKEVIAVVSIDIYGVYDEETNSVRIDPKKLYCMLEAAYIARLIHLRQRQLVTRSVILSGGSEIYSAMFTKVLNKKYSLNIDKSKMHKVLFLASKFYMINVLGLPDSDMVFNYAIKNCPNGNIYSLQEVNELVPPEAFENLETFINALKLPALNLGFKDLSVRGYLEAFINMYEASNLLSLECLPYFLYNIISVTNGGYINNQYILESIVGNTGSKIYNDLLVLDK